jgi:hypothetical protein
VSDGKGTFIAIAKAALRRFLRAEFANAARDVIGTNQKNQQTKNGQTTEPQLVSVIISERVAFSRRRRLT